MQLIAATLLTNLRGKLVPVFHRRMHKGEEVSKRLKVNQIIVLTQKSSQRILLIADTQ